MNTFCLYSILCEHFQEDATPIKGVRMNLLWFSFPLIYYIDWELVRVSKYV